MRTRMVDISPEFHHPKKSDYQQELRRSIYRRKQAIGFQGYQLQCYEDVGGIGMEQTGTASYARSCERERDSKLHARVSHLCISNCALKT